MKDDGRTEADLRNELQELRLKVAQLENIHSDLIATEKALRKSEERLNAILNVTTELILLIDAEGVILALNKPAAERFGQRIEELIGKNVTDFLEPELASRRKEQINRVLRTGQSLRFQDERADRILDHSMFPVLGQDQKVEGIAVFARDVTGQCRAENQLAHEKEKFQTLFEQAPLGMAILGRDGRFRHINTRFSQMFGYGIEDLTDSRGWWEMVCPDADCRGAVIEDWLRRERGDELSNASAPRVLEVASSDGARRSVKFTYVRLHSGVLLMTCEDITEFHRTEEALLYGQAMLKTILSASPVAISYVEEGRLKWTNQAMVRMFGYDSEPQYLGKKAVEFYVSDEEYSRVLDIFKQGLERNEPVETEAHFRRLDGSVFCGQVKISALEAKNLRKGTISAIADITDKKVAEELLRRSQERYRTLVEESFDGILVREGDTIAFANTRLHEMLGYNRGELEGLSPDVIYDPAFQDLERERTKIPGTGKVSPSRYEVRLKRKDGYLFDAEINARTVAFGARPGVQMWIKDITERKTAEAAMRESEERFRRLSDAAEEGIAIHNEGFILDANAALARMFGYELDELIGINARRLATPESWELLVSHVASDYDKPYEAIGSKKDGSTFWCQLIGKSYQYQGKTLHVTSVNDITFRKQAEESLRRSREEYRTLYEESKRGEDLYRSLLNSSADAVIVYDLDGRAQYVNDSFTRIFGWTLEEVRDTKVPYVPDTESEASMAVIARLMAEGTPCSGFETKRFTKDGRVLDISLSASRYHNHTGKPAGMLVVLRDVTERKRLEEQLRQAAKMEAIGRLAGGVAHDFNNLLTAVIGYSHMLMQRLPEESYHHDKLGQICRAAERAAGLTTQLLAFSRKQVLDVKVVDLNEVISGMDEMLGRLIGEDIQFETVLTQAIGRIKADKGQMEQILMNLVVNARDAMPFGGRLTVETADAFLDDDYAKTRAEVEPGPYVMFAVSDTGHGMSPETMARIFEPFFTTKEKTAGTGLGLATVYGIIKQHRGHISVYSEEGRGTTFKVYLPRVEDLPEQEARSVPTQARPTGTETILVVEDEDTVRSLACEALELLGYNCLSAADPCEAQTISDSFEGPIHLLLTDVILPILDGRSLFRRLSPLRPEMKVLYTSGYTENFVVHHGVLDSDIHFIQKPFTLDGLARTVREVLDQG